MKTRNIILGVGALAIAGVLLLKPKQRTDSRPLDNNSVVRGNASSNGQNAVTTQKKRLNEAKKSQEAKAKSSNRFQKITQTFDKLAERARNDVLQRKKNYTGAVAFRHKYDSKRTFREIENEERRLKEIAKSQGLASDSKVRRAILKAKNEAKRKVLEVL